MRSGFDLSYGRCLQVRRSSRLPRATQALKDLGQFAFCVDFDSDFNFDDSYGEAVEFKMHAILELFTGRTCRDIVGKASALWLNGISAFLVF